MKVRFGQSFIDTRRADIDPGQLTFILPFISLARVSSKNTAPSSRANPRTRSISTNIGGFRC